MARASKTVNGMRPCSLCGETLPATLDNFYKQGNSLSAACRPCVLQRNKSSQYREANRKAKRLQKYRLTEAGFEQMLREQGGRCAVCRTDDPGWHGVWHVDHDHGCCSGEGSCGACIRGLLCAECNMHLVATLERFTPERIAAAAVYINERSGVGYAQVG